MIEHSMQLKLVEVLWLFLSRSFALNDGLSSRITRNQSFVDSIQNRTLDLVMEIHCGLTFMCFCIVVNELLITYTISES